MSDATPKKTVVFEPDKNPYGLKLELSEDGAACFGSITTKEPAEELTTDTLESLLHQQGIKQTIKKSELNVFCQSIQAGQQPTDMLLAQGESPGKGADGRLEMVDLNAGHELYQENELGHVDMKTVRNFDNVYVGQEVARIYKPEEGAKGRTVSGEIIPGIVGETIEVKLDENLSLDPETGVITAQSPGRLVHEGNHLSISETYDVSGDVDYDIGNITFNGAVNIQGDVVDGFSIKATGKITVGGSVGNCIITSDQDIEIGSMTGIGHGVLRAGGSITARYINDTLVEAQGDISVQNELRNCHVKTRGVLQVNGVIVGGESIALKGIEANAVGAPSDTATRLRAGDDYSITDQQSYLQLRLRETKKECESIRHLVGTIRDRIGEDADQPPPDNVRRLLERQDRLQQTQQEIEAELEKLTQQTSEGRNPKINVKNLVYEGTQVIMGQATKRFKDEERGPVSIYFSPRKEEICVAEMTPLTANALDMDDDADSEED